MAWLEPNQYNWNDLEFEYQLLDLHFNPMNGRDIRFVVVHHMMIQENPAVPRRALQGCFDTWQDREASAHYGVEGPYVRQFVNDKDYAWATGNTYGNTHGISIEHANISLAPRYEVREETWKTGARLAAHLHKFYNLGFPEWDKTIKYHGQFNGSECPGPFMKSIIAGPYTQEVQRVYREITGAAPVNPAPAPAPAQASGGNYTVVRGDTLSKIAHKFGVPVRQLAEMNGIQNPDRINVGQVLKVGGGRLGDDQVAREVINGKWGNGDDRINRLRSAGYNPDRIQNIVNDILS